MEAELKRFCEVIIDVVNGRNFDYRGAEAQALRTQHISPDWCGRFGSHAWSLCFDEQTEIWRQMAIDFPDLYFELLGVDCKVNKHDRTANVLMRTAMMRGNVRLLTVCELKWKFSNGRWIWYYHSGMRGVCEY